MTSVPALFDAVVLAGGRASRLGGVDKAAVLVADRALLDRVLDAAANARWTVIVGPPELTRAGVLTVLEDPQAPARRRVSGRASRPWTAGVPTTTTRLCSSWPVTCRLRAGQCRSAGRARERPRG